MAKVDVVLKKEKYSNGILKKKKMGGIEKQMTGAIESEGIYE